MSAIDHQAREDLRRLNAEVAELRQLVESLTRKLSAPRATASQTEAEHQQLLDSLPGKAL